MFVQPDEDRQDMQDVPCLPQGMFAEMGMLATQFIFSTVGIFVPLGVDRPDTLKGKEEASPYAWRLGEAWNSVLAWS